MIDKKQKIIFLRRKVILIVSMHYESIVFYLKQTLNKHEHIVYLTLL